MAIMDDFEKYFRKGMPAVPPFIVAPEPLWAAPTDPSPIKPQDGDVGRLRAQILRLEGQIDGLRKERAFLQNRVAILGRQVEMAQTQLKIARDHPRPVPAWIKKHLKFLIFVCHPDRNAGRQEAAEVTRELLALRGKDCP